MRLFKRQDSLSITDYLRFLHGSTIKGEVSKGVLAEKNARDVLNAVGGVETLTAARTLTAADSGKTFFLSLAAGFATTLPAPLAGLRFKFVVKTAPSSGNYTIVTNGGADIMIGGVNELEVDTADDGPYDANADTITLVQSVAVVGDFIEMVSDGTSWYFFGQTNADGGVTTATT